MLNAIKTFFKEIFTPTHSEGPAHVSYDRGSQSVWHGVLGAAAILILTAFGFSFPVSLAIVIGAYIVKEAYDYARGGKIWDSAEDIISVSIGSFFHSSIWLPLILMAMGIIVTIVSIARTNK